MKGSGLIATVRNLRNLYEAGSVAGLSDVRLLERFVTRREKACLEALVLRHGPMVWGVCRRVLRDHHDAEDAFQTTFLVLARKAASIRPPEKVGNWLYGVAYQTARKARATTARTRTRERQVPDVPEPEASPSDPRNDLAELLDRELSRLPEKYRTPLILCELEGKTHRAAAACLGWPIGTVSGRLSRARALLARRLTRRGVTLPGMSLAAFLAPSQGTASSCVPASLLSSTVKAGRLFAAGRAGTAGVISPEVAALTKEVLKAMQLSRIKIATAALLAFLLAGAGLWQTRTWADAKTRPDKSYRVTVNEVIHEDSVVVTQVEIETLPGSTVELSSEKGKPVGTSISSDTFDPDRPDKRSRFQVTIFADQFEPKDGSTKVVKFMLGHKFGSTTRSGSITSSTSETIAMPAGAKVLADVLDVPIKSG